MLAAQDEARTRMSCRDCGGIGEPGAPDERVDLTLREVSTSATKRAERKRTQRAYLHRFTPTILIRVRSLRDGSLGSYAATGTRGLAQGEIGATLRG